jgi:ParB/RepB/Spo0J family partition protein
VETSSSDKTQVTSLNALFRSGRPLLHVSKAPEDAQTVFVELERLNTSRFQKRVVSAEGVRQLADTIKANGLLQPVSARRVGEELELIAGHRRREAFKLLHSEAASEEDRAKWARIPCIVRTGLTELQIAALSAVENLERDDGDPLEQGLSLLEVKRVAGFANNQLVAEATGMSVQRVTRLVRLAEAPAVLQRAVTPGVLVEMTDKNGTRRREYRKLELTLALAAGPFYRHHEKQSGADVAADRTACLFQKAARGEWTRARLEAEVKKGVGSPPQEEAYSVDLRQETDDSPPAVEEGSARPRRLLFRDKGNHLVVYSANIHSAIPEELKALVERLETLLRSARAQLDVPLGDTNHR